jgi:glutamate/tyrosine decarboxylase-like PLP-dependent enzyme
VTDHAEELAPQLRSNFSAWDAALDAANANARAYLAGLPGRPVAAQATIDELRRALAVPLSDEGVEAAQVVRDLAAGAEPGVVATGSPRYYGFVIGGALPAALAADWLAATWDQNAGLYACGPPAAVVEEVAGRWVLDVLGLPPSASFGFVTGGQMANFTALAAARHAVLAQHGWDVEARGLSGAPAVRVVISDLRHATIDRALRYLGLGTDAAVIVPTASDGRLPVDAVADALAHRTGDGPAPAIVCTQAGEVNSGAIDPLAEICEAAHAAGAWVHVDGAFGLWAAASPSLRPMLSGVDQADSWATDFHKWLNVPYDSGFVACADPDAHRGAMGVRAAYLIHADDDRTAARDEVDWTPEFSRRGRGFAVYAALRSLGRRGVADLVEGCCARARQFAERLGRIDRAEVLNEVVLDQVLVRFRAASGADDPDPAADDAVTRRVIDAVQASGECWMSGTTWRGLAAMRISVVNWLTTEADVDRSVAAVERALASV